MDGVGRDSSPYRILFEFETRLAFGNYLLTSPLNLPTGVRQYVDKMSPQLEVIRGIVRKNQEEANKRTQKYYNAKSKEPDYCIGQRVWLHEQDTKGPKLSHKITCQPATGQDRCLLLPKT